MKSATIIKSLIILALFILSLAKRTKKKEPSSSESIENLIAQGITDCSQYKKHFNANFIYQAFPESRGNIQKTCKLNCTNINKSNFLEDVIKSMKIEKKKDAKTFILYVLEKTWALDGC